MSCVPFLFAEEKVLSRVATNCVTGRLKTGQRWALQNRPVDAVLVINGLLILLIGIGPGRRFGRF